MGKKRRSHQPEPDPVDDLYQHRHDPDEWSQEPVEIMRRPSGSDVISVRLPTAEADALFGDMRQRGERLSEYVRAAVRARLARTPVYPTTVTLTMGYPSQGRSEPHPTLCTGYTAACIAGVQWVV
jgi:hypothetical protein